GNRQAAEFIPAPNVKVEDLAEAAQLASLADETPEGRSIAVLAKEKYGLRGREVSDQFATFVPFTAQTRMSGVDLFAEPQTEHAMDKKTTGSSGSPVAVAVASPVAASHPVRTIRKGA